MSQPLKAVSQVVCLAVIGFSISALFSAKLGLSRNQLVLGYLVTVAIVVLAARSWRAELRSQLGRDWRIGVLAGLVLGALLAITVAGQTGSPRPSGLGLVWSLIWLGLVYGLLDGLLLNVLPIVVVARRDSGRTRWLGWRSAILGLAASAAVTAAYHWGYREYRGPQLIQPLIGNTVITAGYILTGNIAAPLIAHVIMHGAAVVHGMETTTQLPPHYHSPSGERADNGR